MALPPQAIDRMIQEPSATPGPYKELLVLSGALFLLMIVLYVGLAFGYQPYLKREVQDIDKKIQTYSQQIPPEDQKITADFYSALTNLKQLLSTHTRVLPVMGFLERTVMPNVYYNKVSVNTMSNQANVAGIAKNLEDIANQAALLEKQPEVARINFSNAGALNGVWQFTMDIWFTPAFLHANGASSPVLQNNLPAATTTAPAAAASTTPGFPPPSATSSAPR